MADLILVLGGTRSGKSAVAESLLAHEDRVVYVATAAAADDEEMRARIKAHQEGRRASWTTVETTDLAGAVRGAPAGAALLIDGLGTWLARRMDQAGLFAAADAQAGVGAFTADVDDLVAATAARIGPPVVVVADDAGRGLVPADRGSRLWVDLLGTIEQRLSAAAHRVLQVTAGRVTELQPRSDELTADFAGQLRVHGDTMVGPDALDFAVNVHGQGPPPHLRDALLGAIAEAHGYPDQSAARTAVAQRHGRAEDEVLLTAGAAEAFWLLAATVHARRPVVVHPQFTEPEAALRGAGHAVSSVVRREADAWALDPSAVPDDADLVVIGAPNNPTGNLDAPDVIGALCRPGRITLVDEAFIDFVADAQAGLAAHTDLPGLVVVRSVTKLWGLAGIRAGYMLAPAGLVQRCTRARQPWAVSAPALRALEVCAADENYRRFVAATVMQWRSHLLSELSAISSVTAWDAVANFVLIRVPNGGQVYRFLTEAGIALRPSTFPGLGPDYLRITVRPPAVTVSLMDALKAAIAETT